MSIEWSDIIAFVFGLPSHEVVLPPKPPVLLPPPRKNIAAEMDFRHIEPMVFPGPFRAIDDAPTILKPPTTKGGRKIIIYTGVKVPSCPLWIGREKSP